MRVRAIADYRPDDSTHLSFSFGETLELHLETGGTDASYLKATTLGGPEGGKASGLVPAVSAGLIAMEGPRACMVATFTAEHEGERMSDGSQSTRARSCCPRAFIDAPHACQRTAPPPLHLSSCVPVLPMQRSHGSRRRQDSSPLRP